MSTGFKIGAAGIGGLASMIGRGMAIYKENVDVIRALNEHGLRIEGGFSGIQDHLAATGMSLEQFNEMSTKYARVIGQNGLSAFTALVKETDKQVGGFKKFGLTTAEATEYAAEYLQQQRLAGIFGGATQDQQTKALEANMRELNMYSKVMKTSREEMQSSTSELLGRDDLQRMFFTMPEEQRKKAQASFTTMSNMLSGLGDGGKKALEMFTDMAAAPIPETTESFKQLAAYSPDLAQYMLEMVRAQRLGIEPTFQNARAMLELAGKNKDLIRSFAIAGGEAEQVANYLGQMGLSAEEVDAMMKKNREEYAEYAKTQEKAGEKALGFWNWMGQADSDAQGMTNLADGVNQVMATFNKGVVTVTEKLVASFLGEKGIAGTSDALGDAFKRGANKLNEWIDDFKNTDDVLGFMMQTIGKVVAAVGNMLVAAIQAGFASLADSTVTGRVSRMFDWMAGNDGTLEEMTDPTEIYRKQKSAQVTSGGFMGTDVATLKRSGLSEDAYQRWQNADQNGKYQQIPIVKLPTEVIALLEAGVKYQQAMASWARKNGDLSADMMN